MVKIIIHTLGEFSVSYGDKVINEHQKRSKKMWTLLAFLITYHKREISQNELIELLWPQGESNNPSGALKTQLYRLRAMLNEYGFPGDEIVISTSGTYAFNNTIDYEIDSDEFDRLILKCKTCYSEKEKLSCYLEAINLYKGDFLLKYSSEPWVMPINAYYHSVYVKTVISALEILYNFKRYNEVIDICRRVILIEPLDETIHSYLMKALCAIGERKSAMAHYLYVLDLFYNHEGLNPSQSFMALYNELMKTDNALSANVSSIRIEMDEKSDAEGAFFCEYEAFKHIYQLELRESARTQKPIGLCVATVTDKERSPLSAKSQNLVMQRLKAIIANALRTSDVFARYSASQFIIIFPNANEEVCKLVSSRIIRQFKHDYPKSNALIMFSYELIEKEKEE